MVKGKQNQKTSAKKNKKCDAAPSPDGCIMRYFKQKPKHKPFRDPAIVRAEVDAKCFNSFHEMKLQHQIWLETDERLTLGDQEGGEFNPIDFTADTDDEYDSEDEVVASFATQPNGRTRWYVRQARTEVQEI
ncbi:hypothetical protein OAO87_00815 [bacterium]|nr:hypothetical protein [bacterium]